MLKKLLLTLFTLTLLLQPLAVFAESDTQNTNNSLTPFFFYTLTSSTTQPALLALAPYDEQSFLWFIAPITQEQLNSTSSLITYEDTLLQEFLHDLNSTHVISDTTAHIAELSDYLPYGTQRVSEHFIQPSSNNLQPTNQKRKYLGEEFDSSTSYNYLNARYYEANRGQFLSEDPTFLAIGNPSKLQELTQQSQMQFLMNPQQLNSYSYAKNNPIVNKDPDGNFAFAIPLYYGAVTAPEWLPSVITGIGLAATWITADMTLRSNPGQRYIPFNQQGREVRLPGVPDPLNPWDGWKPGPPGDWKTWVGAGLSGLGLAADLYKQYQDYKQDIQQFAPKNPNGQNPSSSYNMPQSYVVQNNTTYARGSNGSLSPTSLPATVSQGGSTYYRNSSGLLSTKPGL